jgi:hypothetical protein
VARRPGLACLGVGQSVVAAAAERAKSGQSWPKLAKAGGVQEDGVMSLTRRAWRKDKMRQHSQAAVAGRAFSG